MGKKEEVDSEMKIWHLRDEGIKRWGLGLSLEEGRSSLLVLLSLGKSLTCALSGRVLPASVTQVTATPCSALWTCSSVLPTSVKQVTAISRKNAFLPPSLLIDLYMPTATCFIFVCVCVCVCVSWAGRGWWLGEMELWVGSNIMIHFLYILLFLIWHMYLYIIHCQLS